MGTAVPMGAPARMGARAWWTCRCVCVRARAYLSVCLSMPVLAGACVLFVRECSLVRFACGGERDAGMLLGMCSLIKRVCVLCVSMCACVHCTSRWGQQSVRGVPSTASAPALPARVRACASCAQVGMVVSVLEDVPSVAPALDGPDDAAESTAVAATTQQSWQWDVDPPSHGSSGGGDSGSSSSSSSSSSSVRGCSGSGGSGSKRSSRWQEGPLALASFGDSSGGSSQGPLPGAPEGVPLPLRHADGAAGAGFMGPLDGEGPADNDEDEGFGSDDEDDVEVEEDEEEEDEEFDDEEWEGGWEGQGARGWGREDGVEGEGGRLKPPQHLRVLTELLEIGQEVCACVGACVCVCVSARVCACTVAVGITAILLDFLLELWVWV